MNIEMIKQVISDYLPDDIIVSKINVTENAGKLMVEIGWDLKDSKPEFTTPISDVINTPEFKAKLAEEVGAYPGTVCLDESNKIDSSNDLNKFIKALDGFVKALEPGEYQKYKNIIIDGYCKPNMPLISFDQPIPLEITGLSGYYKWKKELEKAGCVPEQKSSTKTRAEIDASNAKSIRDAEDEHILNELRKIFPVTPVIDIDTSSKPVLDKVVATKGSDKYIDGLIRAGINPETAREMAGQAAGEIISGIDWAKSIPKDEPVISGSDWDNKKAECLNFLRTETDGYTEVGKKKLDLIDEFSAWEDRHEKLKFKRSEPDGYMAEDGKLIERPRFAKKSSEVVDEYKKAIETYTKRFNIRGKLPGVYNKGKRNAVSLTPHDLPVSDPNRKITEVEVMLLTNDNFVLNPIVDGIETGLKKITAEFNNRFNSAKTERELRDVYADILGKKGILSKILHLLGSVPSKHRVELGNKINVVRAAVDLTFKERLSEIDKDNPTTLIKCKQIFSHIKDIGKIIFK